MVFSSVIFLFAFLPFTLAVYYLLQQRFRNAFLLIMSLAFYAWGEPRFLPVLLLSTIVNYALAIWVEKAKSTSSESFAKFTLTLAVIFNLSLLFIFKYVNFIVSNINDFAALINNQPGFEAIAPTNIVLPIGISFFTFHGMSYVFDVYRGNAEALKNPLNVGLYITLFPQLVAGPIVRFKTISQQLLAREERISDFSEGIKRFIFGLSKKVLIANTLAIAADYAFDTAGGDLTVGLAWIGAICYTLQIYFDFSGYSDMAIGLAKMFGFHFPENFNYPYASASVSEFWRRWHISLSSWFRDYVYIPLGGSHVTKIRLVFNLFIVWGLTGVWHGANWTFILWGLFYFVLLTFEKLTGILAKLKAHPVAAGIYRIFTLLCVTLGWVLFRSNDIHTAVMFLKSMFGFAPGGLWDSTAQLFLSDNFIFLIIGIIFSLPLMPKLKKISDIYAVPNKISTVIMPIVYMSLFIISISFMITNTYNPFIYFNF